MNEALEKTVNDLAAKASEAKTALDAMQFTQAALNATNALACLSNIKR